MTRRAPRSARRVLATVIAVSTLTLVPATAMAEPAPVVPDDLVVVSSTALGAGFTMSATNIGTSPVQFTLPAPAPGAVTVDLGDWDGSAWTGTLSPGTTATMTSS